LAIAQSLFRINQVCFEGLSEQVKSSQVYFIATFKMRKKKQRKTIQSPSQPYLIAPL